MSLYDYGSTAEFFPISALGYPRPRLGPQATPAHLAERFCREADQGPQLWPRLVMCDYGVDCALTIA